MDTSTALPVRSRGRPSKIPDIKQRIRSSILQGELRPVRLDLRAIPRLDPAARVTPIRDLDELIERLSAAVEDLKDADEFERLLDGVSRLFHPRPPDFQGRTAPLVNP